MSLADITREAVLAATTEYDDLGPAEMQERYGITPAFEYVLIQGGQTYDAKSIVNIAHEQTTGVPLPPDEFGADQCHSVARLRKLEFPILRRRTAESIKTPRYGAPIDIAIGTRFAKQTDVYKAGVHRSNQGGIAGNAANGAESIIVSGGYEDDEDYGTEIIYTGQGGRGTNKIQVADQTFANSHNAALVTSKLTGQGVRVVRGADRKSEYAPQSGFRYDGLFRVDDSWLDHGRSGHAICRYRLVQLDEVTEPSWPTATLTAGNVSPGRREARVQRVIRSSDVADDVKSLHNHTCQVCNTRLAIGDRGFSEGAHIRGLGRPHDGPDVPENVLCLCPNCHVLFDNGALIINTDLTMTLNGADNGTLRTHPDHFIDPQYLEYQREIHST